MPVTAPTKPNELKRRAGNPGKRPLPQPLNVLPMVESGAPPMPRGLGTPGKRFWVRVWTLGREWLSSLTDIDLLTRLAQAHDEREKFRADLARDGYWQTTRDGLLIAHPALRELRKIEAEMIRMESLCGFTPSDRSRLGLAEVQRVSKLDAFLTRKQQA